MTTGRTALITGGAGHVAEAFAEALLELGTEVCLVDVAERRLAERASALNARFEREVRCAVANVGAEAHHAQIADENRRAVVGADRDLLEVR